MVFSSYFLNMKNAHRIYLINGIERSKFPSVLGPLWAVILNSKERIR